MINNDCLYCNRNQSQKDLMIEICDLQVSTAFLFKEQTHSGRCIVAYKDHEKELFELSDNELLAYMQDVNKVAKAMQELFEPEKINFGAYSDKLPHLHFHLVPKYVDGTDYGSTFTMNRQEIYLSDAQYAEIIHSYKNKLR